MSKKPFVLILRGYCGTGKSSVAKHIATKEGFAFLEYDNFLWAMNPIKSPSEFHYKIAFKNFTSVLNNYLKTNKNILIEGPLVPRTEEDPFDLKKVVSIIKKTKHQLIMVQLVASEKKCLERMKKRKYIVPKWERDMFKSKHNASRLPGEIILDNSKLSLNETIEEVEKILKEVL